MTTPQMRRSMQRQVGEKALGEDEQTTSVFVCQPTNFAGLAAASGSKKRDGKFSSRTDLRVGPHSPTNRPARDLIPSGTVTAWSTTVSAEKNCELTSKLKRQIVCVTDNTMDTPMTGAADHRRPFGVDPRVFAFRPPPSTEDHTCLSAPSSTFNE